MTETILTQPDIPIYLFMAAVAVYTCLLLAVVLVLVHTGPALLDAVIAWGRRTFTKAGDGCATCNGWHVEVYCFSCKSVRVLRATETIPHMTSKIAIADFAEERRRREAMAAYDELDLDLDEQAVM